jgi:Reverse transcriptase (RNA-dependent DNA polymerase)
VIFALHIDDIILIASSADENACFQSLLTSRWDISTLGPAKLALGIALSHNRTMRTISLSQSAMIDRLLDKFGQSNAHPINTPMVTSLRLKAPNKNATVDVVTKEWCAHTPFQELVGSLIYITISTHPNISFAVSKLFTFLDCFYSEHWEAGIHVLQYLKGTCYLSLVLSSNIPISLSGHSDLDYANCPAMSHSVSGYSFSLGSGAVSWCSHKQHTVANSSCYAKYITLHETSHEAVFLCQLLDGIGFAPTSATVLHCNNVAATMIAKDHIWHSHIKHIRIKYHYIQELIASGELNVVCYHTTTNIANILTKPLAKPDFCHLCHSLRL